MTNPFSSANGTRLSDFSDRDQLAERLMAYVSEWNAHAHPAPPVHKSAARVMAQCDHLASSSHRSLISNLFLLELYLELVRGRQDTTWLPFTATARWNLISSQEKQDAYHDCE